MHFRELKINDVIKLSLLNISSLTEVNIVRQCIVMENPIIEDDGSMFAICKNRSSNTIFKLNESELHHFDLVEYSKNNIDSLFSV